MAVFTSLDPPQQPWFDDNPEAWDWIIINGPDRSWQLLCEYQGKRTTRIDSHAIISGQGADPGALRRDPSTFTFTIKVLASTGYAGMSDYEAALSFALNKGGVNGASQYGPWPKAFSVNHPALAQLEVTSVYLESVTPLVRKNAREPATSTWSFIEFLPAQFVLPKTVAPAASTNAKATDTVQNPPSTQAGVTGTTK